MGDRPFANQSYEGDAATLDFRGWSRSSLARSSRSPKMEMVDMRSTTTVLAESVPRASQRAAWKSARGMLGLLVRGIGAAVTAS